MLVKQQNALLFEQGVIFYFLLNRSADHIIMMI